MTGYPPGCAFFDGRFCAIEDARISVLDWGFLRSDATYDVVHVWKGRFFRLDRHLDRFFASAETLKLAIPHSRDAVAAILAECVRRSGLEDAYVEMVITRGVSPTFSRDPRDAVNRFFAFAIPFGWILRPQEREAGLAVAVARTQRIGAASVDPTVKNYHWLDLVMGLYEAYDKGAGTVVLPDDAGNVTEGPGFNIFAVRDGRVATPAAGVLHGITRLSALELLAEAGIATETRAVPLDELRAADEIFATSTAGGIMPVTSLDGSPVGDGRPGPVTRDLIAAYWVAHARPDWSTAVADPAATEPTG
ncbi:aminotransferase class IV [Microbaculum marinisediminis]|uniref:Probable branched-chain-amino-acid aminotransferase n=1 Tax=Microbaculum marinisediminis TaxID=2931392 RepID=A0AAW5QZV1_9HYPH|nr:aminotransferase class IV [Microbaculum sp. A6E488]MCT8972667.1 aminotransferase class IV [Microbaculum sp. A6E488]